MIAPNELYWTLLQPSSLILLSLALSALLLIFRAFAAGRALFILTLFLTLLPALLPIRDYLLQPLERYSRRAVTLPPRVDGIIVLGGAVDWRVTEGRGQVALNEAGERMVAAAALARAYPQAPIIFTGVFQNTLRNEFTEAFSWGRSFFGNEWGNRRILFVGQARSTYEDAIYAASQFQPQAGETWLLVTSAMHMPRAVGVFRAQGWPVVPYAVDYRSSGVLRVAPSWDVLGEVVALDAVLREWGALFLYQRLGRTRTLFPSP